VLVAEEEEGLWEANRGGPLDSFVHDSEALFLGGKGKAVPKGTFAMLEPEDGVNAPEAPFCFGPT
jgi:hypothetical protein